MCQTIRVEITYVKVRVEEMCGKVCVEDIRGTYVVKTRGKIFVGRYV